MVWVKLQDSIEETRPAARRVPVFVMRALLLWSTRQKYSNIFLDHISVRDDSQGLIETCLPHVLRELFPMNPAVDGFRLVVRQTDLARPEAPLKVTVCGHGLTPIDRLTRRSQRQESHGVEHVRELSYQIESGSLVLIRRFAEILLKIDPFLRFISDDHVRNHGQVGISIVLESSLPI